MATNTDHLVDVAKAIQAILEVPTLDLRDVFYGDQTLIPRVPAACVETGNKVRELRGAHLMTENTMTVYIMVYHGQVADAQVTKQQCDEKAEEIELALHQDVTLGGLVVHGYCTEVDPGYAQRQQTLYYATRITWQGLTKTRLTTRETP